MNSDETNSDNNLPENNHIEANGSEKQELPSQIDFDNYDTDDLVKTYKST